MCKSSVGGWVHWGHVSSCVGGRLTELTGSTYKLSVSEPAFVVSCIMPAPSSEVSYKERCWRLWQGVFVCLISAVHHTSLWGRGCLGSRYSLYSHLECQHCECPALHAAFWGTWASLAWDVVCLAFLLVVVSYFMGFKIEYVVWVSSHIQTNQYLPSNLFRTSLVFISLTVRGSHYSGKLWSVHLQFHSK